MLSEIVDELARKSTVVGGLLCTPLVNSVSEVTINIAHLITNY